MSKTVSGELITIDDSAYDGMDDIVIYGKTVQNLWFNPSGTQNGVTVTANANGSITVAGTSTGNVSLNSGKKYTLKRSTVYILFVDKKLSDSLTDPSNGSFFIKQHRQDGSLISGTTRYIGYGNALSVKFTTSKELSYVYMGVFSVSGKTLSGTYRVMLREATEAEITAAASTPQTLPVYPDDSGPDASNEELGIMPLNDDVSILADSDFDNYWCPPGISSIDNLEILTAGANLFTLSGLSGTFFGVTYSENGDGEIYGIGTPTTATIVGNYISRNYPIKPNTNYSLSVDRNSDYLIPYIGIYPNQLFSNRLQDALLRDRTSMTISTNSEAKYILYGMAHEGLNIDSGSVKVMFNEGDIALPWEKTEIISTTIDLQGYSLNSLPDGTRDELRIDKEGNVTLIQRVANASFTADDIVLGGTLEYAEVFIGYSSQGYVYNGGVYGTTNSDDTINDFALNANPDSVDGCVKCWVYSLETNGVPTGNAVARFGNGKAENSNTEQINSIKSIIGDRTIHVLYKLYNPKTISLGKIDLPKLRKKPLVNNVWAIGSAETTGFYLDTEMELTYRRWPGVRADGFKVSGKHNFWDFASCVASSDSGKPEKKFVTATVPYMSGFYDLSKIYGAIAYESRDVSYTFELLGDDMDDLQRQKTNLLDWLGLVHDEPIYDDTQQNYHYVGSFYEADWEEDETGESGTLTVTFRCQPFLIADRATEESLRVGTHTVVNHGQQVSVFAKANSGSATVKINGVIQAVTTTEQRLTAQLQPGENEVVVTSNSVTLRYYELHL